VSPTSRSKPRHRTPTDRLRGLVAGSYAAIARVAAFASCAEEDSNLHPVIPDQALNLATQVAYRPLRSKASDSTRPADDTDASDDPDVASDVATPLVSGRRRGV
jgi:hypothetical protein